MRSSASSSPEGKQSFYPFQHGTLRAGVYAPKSQDPQEPHDQDELYVVIRGTGSFAKDGETRTFKPGDAIFVEAGADHAFTDFSDDFATWVIFWGPRAARSSVPAAMLRDDFLDGMSRAACTVSVVTTDGAAGRAGVTVSAMASVSADSEAPSLLVCINHQSAAARIILGNGVFCVNVLREDQAVLSDRFAGRVKTSSGDKFEGVSWRRLHSGLPVLDGVLVAFDCQLRQYLQHGTHVIFIGELVDIVLSESSSPLIYANRAYGRPAPLEALRRGREAQAGRSGPTLRIGCLAAPAAFVMGELLAAYAIKHPEIAVELVESGRAGLAEALRHGDLDLALTYDLDLGTELEAELLGEIRPYVRFRRRIPWRGNPRSPWPISL